LPYPPTFWIRSVAGADYTFDKRASEVGPHRLVAWITMRGSTTTWLAEQMKPAPTVFISYSHDDDKHKSWVRKLAEKLVSDGVDTVIDQWDLSLGADLAHFMEQGLTNAQRILVICTNNYNKKANAGTGGVGYEKTILTAELLRNQATNKFIPVVRGSEKNEVPICLGSRLYIDFSDDAVFESRYQDLLRELHAVPTATKPALGKNPFAVAVNEVPSINGQISTAFFAERFSKAFPGLRGQEKFTKPEQAVQRLNILLRSPIVFKEDEPIWWWRDGERSIDEYHQIDETSVVLAGKELDIEEMVAVNAGAYHQEFVYIKTKACEPTGLYGTKYIANLTKVNGYASEGYGLYRGNKIKYEELEDGAAVIDGVPVELNGEGQFRERFVTPYNLIIAPAGSPIGSNSFDSERRGLLNDILHGKASLDDFKEAVLRLPKLPHR
jgi:hypothetical protein